MSFKVFAILKNVFVVFGVWKKGLRKVLIVVCSGSFLFHEFQSISNFKECFCCVWCLEERTQKGANCW